MRTSNRRKYFMGMPVRRINSNPAECHAVGGYKESESA